MKGKLEVRPKESLEEDKGTLEVDIDDEDEGKIESGYYRSKNGGYLGSQNDITAKQGRMKSNVGSLNPEIRI